MAKIKKAMKGGSKVAGGKKGKKAPESDQASHRPHPKKAWPKRAARRACVTVAR